VRNPFKVTKLSLQVAAKRDKINHLKTIVWFKGKCLYFGGSVCGMEGILDEDQVFEEKEKCSLSLSLSLSLSP